MKRGRGKTKTKVTGVGRFESGLPGLGSNKRWFDGYGRETPRKQQTGEKGHVLSMDQESELVKVHFELPEPDMGVSGESLWAAPVGTNLYELRNSPWHVRTVNWLDVVEAVPRNEDEWPEFVRVLRRSGHRTVHIFILDTGKNRRQEILDNCNRLGSTYEGADDRLYALDFPPGTDTAPTIEYLEGLEANGTLSWRINEYAEPGHED